MRLDVFLAEHGLTKSRSRAAELISAGHVCINGKAARKASADVSDSDKVEITGEIHPYVGRGGVKLEGALENFDVDVTNSVCADIGASTGGFTDCLLKHGAAFVYAIDSGHGQLDRSLLANEKVKNIENFNARFLTSEVIGEKCDIVVADLSFISQTLIIPTVAGILKNSGKYIALIKPQFECGREALGKNGIVKDKNEHIAAIRKVLSIAAENGLYPKKLMKSKIKGGDGNTEFLFLAERVPPQTVADSEIKETVNE